MEFLGQKVLFIGQDYGTFAVEKHRGGFISACEGLATTVPIGDSVSTKRVAAAGDF